MFVFYDVSAQGKNGDESDDSVSKIDLRNNFNDEAEKDNEDGTDDGKVLDDDDVSKNDDHDQNDENDLDDDKDAANDVDDKVVVDDDEFKDDDEMLRKHIEGNINAWTEALSCLEEDIIPTEMEDTLISFQLVNNVDGESFIDEGRMTVAASIIKELNERSLKDDENKKGEIC